LIDDDKVEVSPQIIDNTMQIGATHVMHKPKGKMKVRMVKAKVPVKKSRLEKVTSHLYDLRGLRRTRKVSKHRLGSLSNGRVLALFSYPLFRKILVLEKLLFPNNRILCMNTLLSEIRVELAANADSENPRIALSTFSKNKSKSTESKPPQWKK
jgi:hypothetical protein